MSEPKIGMPNDHGPRDPAGRPGGHKKLRTQSVIECQTNAWISFGFFVISFITLSFISIYLRYALPAPKPLPQPGEALYFSEALAMSHVDHLAGTIGYRIVGTEEMTETVEYLLKVLDGLKAEAVLAGGGKELEIWHQKDDGAHLFEFMGKLVWKKYFQLSNVIVRVSDPSIPSSKENAILVNAHLDSTLPSPGAADDVAGVSVLLEAIRIVTQSPKWKMYNSIVFLFNGAEESLQDASHLFITKHPLKDVVRAVINLEACGTDGQEILFQATSEEVPRPFGTIVATEVFHTGLIASDTDFRQFEQYGNLTGLDMAIMQNSYLYHTRQDIPSNIEKGAIQHMGENTLALLKYLTAESADLTNIRQSSSTVFFSALGGHVFFMYSKTTALQLYLATFMISISLALRNVNSENRKVYALASLAVPISFLASVIAPNLVAFITATVLQKPLSWYRHEALPIVLFGPPSFGGALLVQYILSSRVRKKSLLRPGQEHVLAHATFCGLIVFYGSLSVLGAFLHIGTAYLPAIGLGSLAVALGVNDLILMPLTGKHGHLHLPTYFIVLVIPCLFGVEGLLAFLDIFVPLTGRMGHEIHVDHIIAGLVSSVSFNLFSVALPFSHRFCVRALKRSALLAGFASLIFIVIFTRDSWAVFDKSHPKRLLVIHLENLTTTPPTFNLHMGSMDRAPGFYELVKETMELMAISEEHLILNAIDDDIPDWDIIYPISQFLKSYQIPLVSDDHQLMTTDGGELAKYRSPWTESFKLTVLRNKLDYIHQHRLLSIALDHPGIIWTVIAFTADVVEWDLPQNPGRGLKRHHVKEASAFGVDRWMLNMTIALSNSEFEAAVENEQRAKGQRPPIENFDEHGLGMIRIDYSGLDQMGLFPARAEPRRRTPEANQGQKTAGSEAGWIGTGTGGPGMKFFRTLDQYLPDWADPMLLSAVSNVAYV